jgi:hypothetical protein
MTAPQVLGKKGRGERGKNLWKRLDAWKKGMLQVWAEWRPAA